MACFSDGNKSISESILTCRWDLLAFIWRQFHNPIHLANEWTHLTHWGRVTHICVGKLTIIGSDNGLSPERRQAIIWTNAGILLIGPVGTNFNEILIEIQTFSLNKIRLKMSSAKCCSFRLGLNVLSLVTCQWTGSILVPVMAYFAQSHYLKQSLLHP